MKINFKSDKFCTIFGLIVNFLLFITKFLAGIFGKSQTMIADAIHSLSDEIATFVVFISLKYSEKPPDKNHPYGHGNIEVITALFVSLLILITGIFLGYSAMHNIVHKHYNTVPENITIYIAILSIFIKEFLFRYTYFVGRLLNSTMIIANAYDHRSDALSSVGALVAILAAKFALPIMDPIGSIIISLFVLKMGIDILKENVLIIMDTTPSTNVQQEIETLITNVNGVKNISFAKIHPVGRHLFIETEIMVDKQLTLQHAHEIAEEVKSVLKSKNLQIKDVVVHVEPQ
jgi:cation diffusion facilitator family transporter